jgi:hypothetical protein
MPSQANSLPTESKTGQLHDDFLACAFGANHLLQHGQSLLGTKQRELRKLEAAPAGIDGKELEARCFSCAACPVWGWCQGHPH